MSFEIPKGHWLLGKKGGAISPVALFLSDVAGAYGTSLIGTVAVDDKGVVTGTGTKFKQEVEVGDLIEVSTADKRIIESIDTDLRMKVTKGLVVSAGTSIKTKKETYLGFTDDFTVSFTEDIVDILAQSSGTKPMDQYVTGTGIEFSFSLKELTPNILKKLDSGFKSIEDSSNNVIGGYYAGEKIFQPKTKYILKAVRLSKKIPQDYDETIVRSSLSTDKLDTVVFRKVSIKGEFESKLNLEQISNDFSGISYETNIGNGKTGFFTFGNLNEVA